MNSPMPGKHGGREESVENPVSLLNTNIGKSRKGRLYDDNK